MNLNEEFYGFDEFHEFDLEQFSLLFVVLNGCRERNCGQRAYGMHFWPYCILLVSCFFFEKFHEVFYMYYFKKT